MGTVSCAMFQAAKLGRLLQHVVWKWRTAGFLCCTANLQPLPRDAGSCNNLAIVD